jgi:hypothetical protein
MLGRSGMTMVEPFGVRWHRCTHEGCPAPKAASDVTALLRDCILPADMDIWAVKNAVIEQRLGR